MWESGPQHRLSALAMAVEAKMDHKAAGSRPPRQQQQVEDARARPAALGAAPAEGRGGARVRRQVPLTHRLLKFPLKQGIKLEYNTFPPQSLQTTHPKPNSSKSKSHNPKNHHPHHPASSVTSSTSRRLPNEGNRKVYRACPQAKRNSWLGAFIGIPLGRSSGARPRESH